MIASCLVKDPSKRPPAKKLLKHSFFRKARSNDYIARTLLGRLPPLGDCMKALKVPNSQTKILYFPCYDRKYIYRVIFLLQKKEEDMLAQKKMPDGQMEELSQVEIAYI